MDDIFGTDARPKAGQICIGDDLYSLSVTELSERISALQSEISRTEAALTKKRAELSEAETLFAPRGSKDS